MPQKILRSRIAVMNQHYRYCSIDDFFSALSREDISSVDLWSCGHHFFLDHHTHQDAAALQKRAQKRYGLSIICFTPEQSCPKPYNMAAANPEARERTLRYYDNALACAVEFGGLLQVTAGWHYLSENRETVWARSRDMLGTICSHAEHMGVRVLLEAVSMGGPQMVKTLVDVARMLDEIRSPALGVVADTTNLEVNGDHLDTYFQTLGSRICHVHLVDGTPAGHLAWGDGTRDLSYTLDILEQYGYMGYLTLETVGPTEYLTDPAGTDQKSIQRLRPYLQ